jgi:hypothetical protein
VAEPTPPAAAPGPGESSLPSDAPAEPVPFPPPDVPAPHERSAHAGDGVWQLLGDAAAGDRAARDPRVVAWTVLHPHPTSRFISVTVAAIDLSRAAIGYRSGTDDPKPKHPENAPGLIPPEDLPRAIAVFNGGFQAQHGRWGMRVGEDELVRPRVDGCTVAVLQDGRVRVAPWPQVEADLEHIVAYRQTPPCLIHDGALSSHLRSGNLKIYKGDTMDVKTRRRSGIGVDAAGQVLFFAVSEEGDARHLAEGLRAAGATSAAQLDINWNWTRFLLVADTPDGPRIGSPLLSGMNHGRSEYTARPTARDFFYVTTRTAP